MSQDPDEPASVGSLVESSQRLFVELAGEVPLVRIIAELRTAAQQLRATGEGAPAAAVETLARTRLSVRPAAKD